MAKRRRRDRAKAVRNGGREVVPSPSPPGEAERSGARAAARRLWRSVPVRLALLGLLLTLSFAGSLTASGAWDDCIILSANPAIRSLTAPWRFFTDAWTANPQGGLMLAQYRPLRTLFYAVEFAVFRGNAWGYHLCSILLHVLCAWLVGLLARELFGAGPGWIAASIWLLHPILAENVLYLAAQGNLLCLVGVLGALLCHLRRLETSSRWSLAGMVGFGLLGMFAYEFGAVLPLLAMLTGAAWRSHRGRAVRPVDLLRTVWPLGLALAAYLACRQSFVGRASFPAWWGGNWTASLELQLRIWLEALRLSVFPVGFLPRYLPADIPAYASFPLAAIVTITLGAAVVACVRKRRLVPVALAVLWWYLAQGATSNLIVPNLGYMFAPRFLFLALVFPVVLAAQLAYRLGAGRVAGLALAAPLVAGVVAVNRGQTRVWQSDLTLYARLLEARPDDFTARLNLATALTVRGRWEEGLQNYALLHQRYARDGHLVYLSGLVYEASGDRRHAEESYRQALLLDLGHPLARARLARLELRSGRTASAWVWLGGVAHVESLNPFERAQLLMTRALASAASGACATATSEAESALKLWRYTSPVLADAAKVYATCHDRRRAVELFRAAAERARDDLLDMVGDTADYE